MNNQNKNYNLESNKLAIAFSIFLVLIFTSSFINAADSTSVVKTQYFSPSTSFNSGYENLMSGVNAQTTSGNEEFFDMTVTIPPLGCSPYVVRSDLLEEQNVPVFCQLIPLKVNPGLDITRIERISVKQQGSNEYISGVGFHPARAAIRSTSSNLMNNPTTDNLGYVVVVLKKQPNEKIMPDNVTATLAISLEYGANYAYGIGENEFYLPELTDDEFSNNLNDYGFYDGVGYLRAEDIDETGAKISVYDTSGRASAGLRSVFSDRIEVGKTSKDFYLYTTTGGQGLRVSLKDITVAETKAKIKVNGQIFEVYKGKTFYNGKCQVIDLKTITGGTGSARISCNGKTFNLQKQFNKVDLTSGTQKLSLTVGEEITFLSDGQNSYYLVYTGQKGNEKTPFIIIAQLQNSALFQLTESEKTSKLVELNRDIETSIKNNEGKIDQAKINTLIGSASAFGFSGNAKFFEVNSPTTINSKTLSFSGLKSEDKGLKNPTDILFENAKNNYDYVKDSFGSEGASQDYSTRYSFGELALWTEYQLARDLGQMDTANTILSRIENEYPSSTDNSGQSARSLLGQQGLLSNEGSTYYDEKEDVNVELLSVNEPSSEDASVKLVYNSDSEKTLHKGGVIVNQDNKKITINSFDENNIYVDYTCKDAAGVERSGIRFAGNKNFMIPDCSARIVVNQINIKKVAHIQVTPIVHGRSRESNFTFSIGIEKRAVAMNLTPEEADKKIVDLNKQIAEWKNITESLSQFIKTEKMACLATTGVVNLMNLVAGAKGEATARQTVMKKWNELCAQKSYNANYNGDVDECIAGNYATIKDEITKTKTAMDAYNTLYQAESKNELNKVKGVVDDAKVKQKILAQIQNKITTNKFYDSNGNEIICKDAYTATNTVPCSQYAQSILTVNNVNYMSYSELSDLYVSLDSSKDSSKTYSILQQIEQRSAENSQVSTKLSGSGLTAETVDSIVGNKQTSSEIDYTGHKFSNLPSEVQTKITSAAGPIDSNTRISSVIFTQAGSYVYFLEGSEAKMTYSQIWKVDGTKAVKLFDASNPTSVGVIPTDATTGINEAQLVTNVKINVRDAQSYKNKCTNCNYVKVFNTEPYKGMINILPFDCEEGWYVQVKQLFPGLGTGEVKSYQDSGRVNSFWLCNVGKNGLMETVGIGDDVCRRFDTYTGDTLDSFGGLTKEQAKVKVSQAINAIEKAQSDLTRNPLTINSGVSGATCSNLAVKAAEGDFGSKCTDFMSPKQCQLIFNVCDPVVCPNSRCDFGGTYKVDNVIQSGIIGSTFLCLPNFIGFHPNTGVVIPVCLTGINAGIEGWVSILESYRDCINESVTNNKTVGICDAVQSIYVCDFFWKQAGPLVQAFTKNLFYAIFGKGDQGGGEYLFVQDSWTNAEKSVQFMENLYGKDSSLKFGFNDVSNVVADQVCKSSASASYPDNFDSMLEPESPVQFYASFEEMPYTDATIPPKSQYKVIYHIYAGNDQGHYYQIYLKSAPTSLGYVGKDYSSVASGYVSKGQRATETKDFIDTSGFKELCVKIDAKEECGFKSVSTSAALNYASDAALGSQATESVTSESECIAGSTSLGSLLTPNVQQAASEALNPELYNQGIIRVCANEQPDKTVNPSRWKDVGYCSDKTIRCWIDTNSVKKAITVKGIENQTLEEINNLSIQNLIDQQGYLPVSVATDEIEKLKKVYSSIVDSMTSTDRKGKYASSNDVDILGNNFYGRTFETLDEDVRALDKVVVINSQKALLFYIKANLYDKAARKFPQYAEVVQVVNVNPGAPASGASAPVASAVYDDALKIITVNTGTATFSLSVSGSIIKYGKSNVGTFSNGKIVIILENLQKANIPLDDSKIIVNQLSGKTLGQLISTSPSTGIQNSEVEMLAKMIDGEEGIAGNEAMYAAGWIAINRMNKNSVEFGGNTLSGVITKPNQFVGYATGVSDSGSLNIASLIWKSRGEVPEQYKDYLYFVNIQDQNPSSITEIKNKFEICGLVLGTNYKQITGTTMFISKTFCPAVNTYVALEQKKAKIIDELNKQLDAGTITFEQWGIKVQEFSKQYPLTEAQVADNVANLKIITLNNIKERIALYKDTIATLQSPFLSSQSVIDSFNSRITKLNKLYDDNVNKVLTLDQYNNLIREFNALTSTS